MKKFILPLVLFQIALYSSTKADILSELNPQEQKIVRSGKIVAKEIKIPQEVWPQAIFYKYIQAEPGEIFKIFTDYEAAGIFPNVKDAKVVGNPTSNTTDVEYILDIPILPDERYTTRNVESVQSPKLWKVDWKILKSQNVQKGNGRIRIEPYLSGSLVCYENHVSPNTPYIAQILKGPALSQMRSVIIALDQSCAE